ncbi:hypothetical protein D3C86_1429200 [compost metagenome]
MRFLTEDAVELRQVGLVDDLSGRILEIEVLLLLIREVEPLILILPSRTLIEPLTSDTCRLARGNDQSSRNFLNLSVQWMVGKEVCDGNLVLRICVLRNLWN